MSTVKRGRKMQAKQVQANSRRIEYSPEELEQLKEPEQLYFAYGSNLFYPQMAIRCPSAQGICIAKLKNFKLAYSRKSKYNAGVLDVLPELGRVVWGVVYKMSTRDLIKLDAYEGKGFAYERVLMTLESKEYPVTCWVYRVIEPNNVDIPPSREYAKKVLLGMQEWRLPYRYRVNFYNWSEMLQGQR